MTAIPHHPYGSPELYAFGQAKAMLVRLNHVEALHYRLESRKIAGEGADRARIRKRHVAEAVYSLGAMSLTGYQLADERIQAGRAPAWPPQRPTPMPPTAPSKGPVIIDTDGVRPRTLRPRQPPPSATPALSYAGQPEGGARIVMRRPGSSTTKSGITITYGR